jgi:predicted Zn-dependent protease
MDWLDGQGDAHADLAEVLALAGRHEDAVGALEQALGRYELKGNLVVAERVRARLAELVVQTRPQSGPNPRIVRTPIVRLVQASARWRC